jgi:lysozyme
VIDDPILIEQLIRHEGLTRFPYTDTVGKLTIGIGRNLTDVGISRPEALFLLRTDLTQARTDLETFGWFAGLTPTRQRALLDMRFNLGPSRFRGFVRLLAAIARHDYRVAADEMLDSQWARQVGIGRAGRLAGMMEGSGGLSV